MVNFILHLGVSFFYVFFTTLLDFSVYTKYYTLSYLEIVKVIERISESNYKEYIKAMIYIEKNIKDELVLDKLYQEYYENDDINLLNDFF